MGWVLPPRGLGDRSPDRRTRLRFEATVSSYVTLSTLRQMIETPRPFRFYDNRQKYLTFVTTCDEKWKIAERAASLLDTLKPRPPALRVFDAGVGDGTVLAHLMRAMHEQYPTMPFYVVGKEISLEDVRLSLEKIPDRLVEHPHSVIVITNLHYA